MSHPVMYCGRTGCGKQLRCMAVGVWIRDTDGVRAGDVYACPTCGREIILGAPQPVYRDDYGEGTELHDRVLRALDTAITPYVSRQYVAENH